MSSFLHLLFLVNMPQVFSICVHTGINEKQNTTLRFICLVIEIQRVALLYVHAATIFNEQIAYDYGKGHFLNAQENCRKCQTMQVVDYQSNHWVLTFTISSYCKSVPDVFFCCIGYPQLFSQSLSACFGISFITALSSSLSSDHL